MYLFQLLYYVVDPDSSGVGRSGVFIAVDILLDKIKKDKEVDAIGTVLQMHSQRMKMIQTPVGPDSFRFLVKIREMFEVGHHFAHFRISLCSFLMSSWSHFQAETRR